MKEIQDKCFVNLVRSLNTNKIAIIPSLVCKGEDGATYSIAESDFDKANLLANWFSQPPQPPKPSNFDEEHYEFVEDEICSVVQWSKKFELTEYTTHHLLNGIKQISLKKKLLKQ